MKHVSDATQIANGLEIEIKVPRTCVKQQHRANVNTTEPKEYFKSTLAIPFLDYLLQELRSRFQTEDTSAYSICSLLPSNITELGEEELTRLSHQLMFWETDLDRISSQDLLKEIKEWKRSEIGSRSI